MGGLDSMTPAVRAALAAGFLVLQSVLGITAENPSKELELPAVTVIGTTPIPGHGRRLRDVPASVQSVTATDLRRQDALDLTEFFERNLSGASMGAGQGNRFQPDLQYRGFVASPLLGLAQGLSVFVDGVRVNEAFGDTVNWDLIPRNAISTMHLLSGSNPAFGLNTLGGALSVQTKSGFAYPGTTARVTSGAFGRRAAEFETGGHGEYADYFLAGTMLNERGWRERSESRVRQLFGKVGWQDESTDIDFSFAFADNALNGSQTLPRSMSGDLRQPYTWPDRTTNLMRFATLRASHMLQSEILVAGNLYLRTLSQGNLSSNVNDDFDSTLAIAPGNAPGTNVRYGLAQTMVGAAIQASADRAVAGGRNQASFGASYDSGNARFEQDTQEAGFSTARQTLGLGDYTRSVRLGGRNAYLGVHASNTFSPSQQWGFTASARYNIARVRLRDQSGTQGALDGDHSFRRLNPAFGVTWNPAARATLFATLAQGMRVPSPVELTCADPAAPCNLPNQFLADPPLKPVIARTLEFGFRAGVSESVKLSGAMYRSVVHDDIHFINTGGSTTAGFFQNVGRTERAGLELGAQAGVGAWVMRASYHAIRATYLSGFQMPSPNNSAADAAGNILVSPGNRLPGVPAQALKLRVEWTPDRAWATGLGVNWYGRQFARGDDNNRDANGALPGYAVANLVLRYAFERGWELTAKVDNLFDRRHDTFGVLGRNIFTGPGNALDAANSAAEQFRSPGMARALWVTLRYTAPARSSQ